MLVALQAAIEDEHTELPGLRAHRLGTAARTDKDSARRWESKRLCLRLFSLAGRLARNARRAVLLASLDGLLPDPEWVRQVRCDGGGDYRSLESLPAAPPCLARGAPSYAANFRLTVPVTTARGFGATLVD